MSELPGNEHKLDLMPATSGDPKDILDKRRDFPGTAALVDRLLPYFRHAQKAMTGGDAGQKFVPGLNTDDFSKLPQSLSDAVIGHLTALQGNAFMFEAQGTKARADEVRDVAETLSGMLNLMQSIGQHEIPGNGKPAPLHTRARNGG